MTYGNSSAPTTHVNAIVVHTSILFRRTRSGGLTQKMRRCLVSAARSAIRMRSVEDDKREALQKLKHDLQNGPLHCFCCHDNCNPDFCKSAKEKIKQISTSEPPAQSASSSLSSLTTYREARSLSSSSSASRCAHSPSSAPDLRISSRK